MNDIISSVYRLKANHRIIIYNMNTKAISRIGNLLERMPLAFTYDEPTNLRTLFI